MFRSTPATRCAQIKCILTFGYRTGEWGARQDPPMSVEEVVASKVAERAKVEVTQAEVLEAVTPF